MSFLNNMDLVARGRLDRQVGRVPMDEHPGKVRVAWIAQRAVRITDTWIFSPKYIHCVTYQCIVMSYKSISQNAVLCRQMRELAPALWRRNGKESSQSRS